MFMCMECGKKFRTVKAAQKAAFGDSGCPKCGSSDIDLDPSAVTGPVLPRGSSKLLRAAGQRQEYKDSDIPF